MTHFRHILIPLLFFLLTPASALADEVTCRFIKSDSSMSSDFVFEVVSTPESRNLGLMYRRSLDEKRGMLFVFPQEGPRSFWMKNTFIELDLLFLDSEFRVQSVHHRALPHSERPLKSAKPAMYVVELKGQTALRANITEGNRLECKGTIPTAIR